MTTPDYDRYQSVKVFGSLDGLRGFSIAAVVWHHYQLDWLTESLPASRRGFFGVDLFFVISGFLIVTLLLRERARKGRIHLRQFYARRSVRIFPLYYAVIGLLLSRALLRGVETERSQEFLSDLPYLALYLSNWIPTESFAHSWSLAAEEQFYLAWPTVERHLQRFVAPVLVVLLVLSQLIQLGWIDPLLHSAFGWSSDEPEMLRGTTFTPILLGVGLAHLLHRRAAFQRLAPILGHPWMAVGFFASLVLLPNFFVGDVRGWERPTMHLLMTGLVGACVIREDHRLAGLLRIRPLRRIGQLCYGIYLLHHMGMAVGISAAKAMGAQAEWLQYLVGAIALYLIAELSFRYFETPFLKLRHRFRP